ncbi:MAG: hypothetical protein Q7J69_03220, partial [Candidatus Omnitrophota bacterium]|nr:hypothetical protein [Candidatus Omnitrophota bacterium]
MVKRIHSTTAWILIQALIAGQILPASAWAADALRTQSAEGAAKSGLEEQLINQPARGFGTRVARVTEDASGVQIAQRNAGTLVGTSSWDVAAGTLSAAVAAAETEVAPSPVSPDQVLDWARQGLAWLSGHVSLPAVQKVWDQISGRTLSIELRANHALTLDLSDDDTTIRMDVSIAPEMADARYEKGRALLYAFGLFHEAAQASGFSTRASIHLLMALYDQLSEEEREQFHVILQSPYVDHGGIWDFFFRQVVDDRQFQAGATRAQKALPKIHLADEDIRGVDTLTLVDRRDAEGVSAAEQNRLDWVTDYRDTWASWLIGMLQFDIPFDYQRFMAIYRDPSIDLDTKRQLLYRIVRSYSVEAERQNAARISRDAAERGQKVAAGRFSTAFLDEGNEVASAQFVRVTDDLRQAVVQLHETATVLKETSRGDREAENAAEILVRSTEGLLTVILQSAGVTRGEVMKFLDIEDHVGEVYGAIEKHQLLRLRAVDRAQAAAEKRREAGALGRRREFDTRPFDQQRQAVQEEGSRLRQMADAARAAFRQAPKETYARMVALQRASETGAINYAYGIGFAPRPGQAPNLRERIRTGGQNTWMSPDLAWVEWTNYLVEFIPLFIGERILRVELPDGRQVDRREVEVNQQQLEVAIRAMADAFAVNIERTGISEYIALARECLCGARLGSQAIETLAAERGITREEAARVVVREMEPAQRQQWVREIAQVAAGLARRADREEERIQQAMVDSWTEGAEVSRFEMLRNLFLVQPDGTPRYAEVVAQAQKEIDPKRDAELLKAYDEAALEKRRPLPQWIMGTTEAPGLTEAFVLSWLEEEMALRNVIRAANHEQDVRDLLKRYKQQLVEMGRVVLREFGYERQIDARAAEQDIAPEEAVLDLIGENEILQAEVAKLAVLRGWAEQTESKYRFNESAPDPQVVVRKLNEADPATRDRIDREGRRIVWEQNRADLQKEVDQAIKLQALDFDAALKQVIESKQVLGQRPYLAHWESARRWVARDLVIQELGLEPNVRRWYREHTQLARTTARQTVVDRYQLRGLMIDPRHNYQSDGTYLQDSDTWAPSPWKMRYLIAAGPSQVDLGGEDTTSKQLKSISIWPKWGGVVS